MWTLVSIYCKVLLGVYKRVCKDCWRYPALGRICLLQKSAFSFTPTAKKPDVEIIKEGEVHFDVFHTPSRFAAENILGQNL